MTELQLYTKLSTLPPDIKAEVNDFIDFLINKKSKSEKKNAPNLELLRGNLKCLPILMILWMILKST